MLGNLKRYELMVLGVLVVIGGLLWLRRRLRNSREAKANAGEPPKP